MDLQSRDILIVDDDSSQARLFEILLNKLGVTHRCHYAPGGREALDFLRHDGPYRDAPRPELIILDLNMPGMNGCAVLHEIKRDANLRCIPVIMFSIGAGEPELSRCYQEHANAYIQKPVDFEGSLRVVQQIEKFWFGVAALPPHSRRAVQRGAG
jgi:two-component system, chemotaxis family, response regulator Rcp1